MSATCHIQKHQPIVSHLAMQIAKRHRLHEHIQDLVAFGQCGVHEAHRTFDPTRKTTFATWAFVKARSAMLDGARAMNWIQKRRSQPTVTPHQSTLATEVAEPGASWGGSPEQSLLRREDHCIVHKALDALDPDSRHLIVENFFEDKSLRDIARDRGQSPSWTSRQRTRTFARMRATIERLQTPCAA